MINSELARRVLGRRPAPDTTRSLADPTRIGCGIVRRLASALRASTTTVDLESII
jgi:hypothetical protein